MSRAPDPRACRICQQPRPRFARDRCAACYQYWRRHGTERPAWRHTPPTACPHCGYAAARMRRGYCEACYVRLLRRGTLAPAYPPTGRPCGQCHQLTPRLRHGLCNACYLRAWRQGRFRQSCANCPAQGRPYALGLCRACWRFQRQYGMPRAWWPERQGRPA